MNDINEPQFRGNQNGLSSRSGPAPQRDNSVVALGKAPYRHLFGLPVVVGLAVTLHLAFLDVPRAWAIPIYSEGYVWDYPQCDDTNCPPCPTANNPFQDPNGPDSHSCGVVCSGNGGSGAPNSPQYDHVTAGLGNPPGGIFGYDHVMEGGGGMPIWGVSEPAITLWLKDTPMSYQPSRGPAISFRLYYKSNPDQGSMDELDKGVVFSVGQYWYTPWLTYLITGDNQTYVWNNGRGGMVSFTNSGSIDYRSQTSLVLSTNEGSVTRTINYPSGALDVFGQCFTGSDGTNRYFLTQRYDPATNLTQFYWNTNTTTGAAYLSAIVDVDGKTNTFAYTNFSGMYYPYTTYTLLQQVTDAANHMTTLQYDLSGAYDYCPPLTNITDASGMSSSVEYYNGTMAATLITPYGTTTFTLFSTPPAVHINELGLRDHLYVYVDADSTGQITNSYAAYCPTTTSFPNLFDTTNSDQRDSFYWGPLQYDSLPAGFVFGLTNSSPYLDLTQLYTTNYLQARQRHWLIDTNASTGSSALGQTLSLERAPSPDGLTQGQITWYDYAGKVGGNPEAQGTMSLPLFEAWLLPNGESRFIRNERNSLAKPTRVIETYTGQGGALQLRTNTLTFATNSIDLLIVTNALGVQVMSNVFNANHQVLTNYNALGEMTVFTYDSSHRPITAHTPSGLTTSNYYGGNGYLAQTVDLEIGRTNSYMWSNGLVYSHTDERGLTVTNTWDALNRLIKVTYPDGTYLTNSYVNLDLVQVVDRMGFTNRYDYNGFGQVVNAVDALNRTITYGYCDCGLLESITDPLNNSTTFTYDLAGRRTLTTYADKFAVSYNYDLMNRLTNRQDSFGTSLTNWYNNQGLVTAVSNAFGRVQFVQPDILDRTTNRVDANGVAVGSTYDNLNRILTRTYPDNGTEHFVYTANVSGPTSYTNQIGNTVLYAYDQAGRKTNEVYVGVTTNQFGFSPASDLLTLTDGKSQTTTWVYDQYGRVTNKLDALSNVMFVYGYDANSRLTSRWTPAKGTTTYGYDAVGNQTNVVHPVSASISLAYDALNRLTTMVDGVGTTTYGYDAVGQLLSEDGPWADDTVSYTYNNRLRSSVSVLAPDASAWTESYGYDTAKRLTAVASPAGSFGYTYDPARHLQVGQLTLPNGAYITNSYDSVARLLSTVLTGSGQSIINSHSYQLNQASQRTQQVFTAGNYVNYTYDNLGQLQSATGKEAGGTTNRLQEQLGYTYDAAGNLNYRTNNVLVQTYGVNSLNELSAVTRSGTFTVAGTTTSPATNVTVNGQAATRYADTTFAAAGFTPVNGNNTFTAIAKDSYGRVATGVSVSYLPASVSYTYDSNGNLTSDGSRCFAYDDENQLTSVWITNVWRSDFAYDGKMRRRIRTEFTWSGSTWLTNQVVRYVYDGNLVIQERDPNNLPQVTYTRGRDLGGSLQSAGGIGGLLARTSNSQLLSPSTSVSAHAYYHADGNGNITCLINTNQAVVSKYLYDPYGNILSQSGSLAGVNLYLFSSKEFHINSGLLYYLYRFYDPSLQRWLNRDPGNEGGFELLLRPVGETAPGKRRVSGDPAGDLADQDNNSFIFGGNGPTDFADIDGRALWPPNKWKWPRKVWKCLFPPNPPEPFPWPSSCPSGHWSVTPIWGHNLPGTGPGWPNDPGPYGPTVYGCIITYSY
ncbi:MAG: RHS repeat-associated core domain-containing protein [Limisphaerales bacterium]